MWLLLGLVAAAGIGLGIDRAFSGRTNGVAAEALRGRRGSKPVRHLRRPGEPAKRNGRTIGLHVVVLPALSNPARGTRSRISPAGPEGAATEEAANLSEQLTG